VAAAGLENWGELMLPRTVLLGAVVALSVATLGVSSAGAVAPVDASGTLDCAITGKVKIAPSSRSAGRRRTGRSSSPR
jgi:hypothetical protein